MLAIFSDYFIMKMLTVESTDYISYAYASAVTLGGVIGYVKAGNLIILSHFINSILDEQK